MVTIRMCVDDMTVEIKGHAKADEEGKDIVCASVSFCFQQLLYSLLLLNEQKECLNRMDQRVQPGDSYLHVVSKEWGRASVRRRFEYASEGFRLIAENYPEYVSFMEV